MKEAENLKNEETQALNIPVVSCRLFWLKYWLVAWVGCCIMLGTIFYMDIRHQQRMDKIWEKYEQDMKELHNGN